MVYRMRCAQCGLQSEVCCVVYRMRCAQCGLQNEVCCVWFTE